MPQDSCTCSKICDTALGFMYFLHDLSHYIGIYDIALGFMTFHWDVCTYIKSYLSTLGYVTLHWDIFHYIGIHDNALDDDRDSTSSSCAT